MFTLLGVSRILAVHTSYSAPVSAWKHLGRVESEGWAAGQPPYNVCVGKEWHRYENRQFLSTDFELTTISQVSFLVLPPLS